MIAYRERKKYTLDHTRNKDDHYGDSDDVTSYSIVGSEFSYLGGNRLSHWVLQIKLWRPSNHPS